MSSRKFFHVTEKKNVPSILSEGLIPKAPRAPPSDTKAIYFWDSLERAQMLLCPGDIIIEVNVPRKYQIYKRRNEAGFLTETEAYEYFVCQKIPSNRLKIAYVEGTNMELYSP